MADRPIIFSGPMVQALLAGRKTQTRRMAIIQLKQPDNWGCDWRPSPWQNARAGDRLWVRENWQALSVGDYLPTKWRTEELRFAATDPCANFAADARGYPWRPSIHMPRWASRLTLVVTDVRLERLQDISEEDAVAEGVAVLPLQDAADPSAWWQSAPGENQSRTAKGAFAKLWESLHGAGSWAENPELVAISFEVHQINIDQMPAPTGGEET